MAMTIDEFVDLAERYVNLGSAVQDQLHDVITGDVEETNPNAVKMLVPFVRYLESQDIDTYDTISVMEDYIKQVEESGEW